MTSEVQASSSSSRGRGAGINKPAWMVQKEREEASAAAVVVANSDDGVGGSGTGAGAGDDNGNYADADVGGGGGSMMERDQFGRVVGGRGGVGGGGGDHDYDDHRSRGGDSYRGGGRGGGGNQRRDYDYDSSRREYSRRDDDRRGGAAGGGGGGGRRGGGGGDDYYFDDRRSRGGGGGGRSSRSDRDHRRGGGAGAPPPSAGLQFHSYEEERDWLNDRRRRRRGRKSLFDVEPTPEQLAEDEARAALEQSHVLVRTGGVAVAATGANIGLNSAATAAVQRYGSASTGGGNNMATTTATMQPQQTRHARRLYIGNIPDLSEEQVHTFFRDAICNSIILDPNTNPNASSHRSQYVDNDPIISVYINRERRFVFLEFKTMEITTACLALDGIDVMGQGKVKVKRPNDYNAALAPMINNASAPQLDTSKLGIVSPTVPDGPNKIFIGGLPYHLTESQVLELLSAFGAVKAFHLVKQDAAATTSKGYCFVEYADPNITQVACMGLQGMEMGGGKQLSCRMAAQQFAQQQQQGGTFGAPVPAPPVQASIVDGVDVDALLAAALGGGGSGGGTVPNVNPAASLGPMGTMMMQPQQPVGMMPTQQMGMYPMGMMSQQQLLPQGLIVSDPLAIANAAASALDAAFGGCGGAMAPMPVPSPAMVPVSQSSSAPAPTRILVLLNMVMDEDLLTEEDHKMLVEEVREEVSRFGKLVSMKIPRPQVSGHFVSRSRSTRVIVLSMFFFPLLVPIVVIRTATLLVPSVRFFLNTPVPMMP